MWRLHSRRQVPKSRKNDLKRDSCGSRLLDQFFVRPYVPQPARDIHTIIPSTTAMSVVAISSVRRLKRLDQAEPGDAANSRHSRAKNQYGRGQASLCQFELSRSIGGQFVSGLRDESPSRGSADQPICSGIADCKLPILYAQR